MAWAGRRGSVAAGFGAAALLSAWSPLAAPFGLLVGLGAALLSLRALRKGGARALSGAALVVSIAAIAVAAAVLALTAGVGRDPTGDPVVSGPSREEAARTLEQAAERTRAARERARAELSEVTGEAPPPKPSNGYK